MEPSHDFSTNPAPPFSWPWLQGCGRLLYWCYFKPYSYLHWLKSIQPNLRPDANPCAIHGLIQGSPEINDFLSKYFWLSLLLPILLTAIIGILVPVPFDWQLSGLLLTGWTMGFLIVRHRGSPLSSIILVISLTILFLDIASVKFFSFNPLLPQMIPLRPLINPYLIGVFFGGLYSITYDTVKWFISFIALITTANILVDFLSDFLIAFFFSYYGFDSDSRKSECLSPGTDILLNILDGTFLAVAYGLQIPDSSENILCCIAFILIYIFRLSRFHLWLLELFWMIWIKTRGESSNLASCLAKLPHHFDQATSIPLPYVYDIVMESYGKNPTDTIPFITYLHTHTNQKKMWGRIVATIALQEMEKCHTREEITNLCLTLDWILHSPIDNFDPRPSQLMKIALRLQSTQKTTHLQQKKEEMDQILSYMSRIANQMANTKQTTMTKQWLDLVRHWRSMLEEYRNEIIERLRKEDERMSSPLWMRLY